LAQNDGLQIEEEEKEAELHEVICEFPHSTLAKKYNQADQK
jgi:hypothetical protein